MVNFTSIGLVGDMFQYLFVSHPDGVVLAVSRGNEEDEDSVQAGEDAITIRVQTEKNSEVYRISKVLAVKCILHGLVFCFQVTYICMYVHIRMPSYVYTKTLYTTVT